MRILSDDMLLDVYQRAIDLQLDAAFLDLLFAEIKRRNLVSVAVQKRKAATKHPA